jgi:hypothetical protein
MDGCSCQGVTGAVHSLHDFQHIWRHISFVTREEFISKHSTCWEPVQVLPWELSGLAPIPRPEHKQGLRISPHWWRVALLSVTFCYCSSNSSSLTRPYMSQRQSHLNGLSEKNQENISRDTVRLRARCSVVFWGITLLAGRSRVRFPMRSLNLSIGLILSAALWPWTDSMSNRNEYQ